MHFSSAHFLQLFNDEEEGNLKFNLSYHREKKTVSGERIFLNMSREAN